MKAEVVVSVNEYTKVNMGPVVQKATGAGTAVRLAEQVFFICMNFSVGLAIFGLRVFIQITFNEISILNFEISIYLQSRFFIYPIGENTLISVMQN